MSCPYFSIYLIEKEDAFHTKKNNDIVIKIIPSDSNCDTYTISYIDKSNRLKHSIKYVCADFVYRYLKQLITNILTDNLPCHAVQINPPALPSVYLTAENLKQTSTQNVLYDTFELACDVWPEKDTKELFSESSSEDSSDDSSDNSEAEAEAPAPAPVPAPEEPTPPSNTNAYPSNGISWYTAYLGIPTLTPYFYIPTYNPQQQQPQEQQQS